jgi:membrane protein required for colicin V production
VNFIDIILLIVVGASILSGFREGFARVAIGFGAAIAGIVFGFWFYGIPASYLEPYLSSRALANGLGFFAIFLGCMILGGLAGAILAHLFKWIGLSWLDRIMGGAFGFVRGVVISVALVTIVLACAPKPPPRAIVESRLVPHIMGASSILADITPHELKDAFSETKEKVKKIWSEHVPRPGSKLRREDA